MLRRVVLILVAVAILVPLALVLVLGGALWVAVGSDAGRSWAESEVSRATGHAFRIAGPVRIVPGLAPSLEAADVALLNPPGFSRPDLASARRVEAQVALLPLLHGSVEVRRLRLVGADVKLERNAAGQGNWQRPPAPQPAAPSTPHEARRFALLVRDVEIDDSVLAWAGPGGPREIAIPRLAATGKGTLKLAGELRVGDLPLKVDGAVWAAAPWVSYVGLMGQGVSIAVHAQAGDAAQASVSGEVNGAALDPRLAGINGIKLDGAWSPGGAHLHAEAASWVAAPGIRIERLALDAPALDQPVHLSGAVAGAAQLSLSAQTGTLATLMAGAPVPLLVTAAGQGGTARLEGTLAEPKALRGLDAKLTASIADLAALAPGAPALQDATFAAHVMDVKGLSQGLAIRGLRASVPQGDLAGDLAASWRPRPTIRGTLQSQRLDVDALSSVFRTHRPPAPVPVPALPPPPGPAAPQRLIPDTPLPTAGLRVLDADLAYSADALTLRGASFRAAQLHLALADSVLRLDPVTATLPGGPVQGRAALDAAASPPCLNLSLHAPTLDLASLLPGSAGSVAVNADLSGQGTTWREVAGTLGGEANLTGVDGQLDLANLHALSDALRGAGVPAGSGQAHLRCVAVRAVANGGVAALKPLLLDAGRLGLGGDGQVNLRDEAPDLHLRATVQLGGAVAEVPLHVTGTLASPKVQAEASGGRFGLTIAGKARDDCGPALADARGGQPGPEPAPPPKPARAERPADLLRSLLR